MAGRLANQYPNEINMSPMSHFYKPVWQKRGIARLWDIHPTNDTSHIFRFDKTFASHYWGQIARKKGLIQRLTPNTILYENSAINQILRGLLPR
jgi:hypothetical protein